MSFNMPFINMILDHVRQQNYDIAIERTYELSNEREIHDELIKQAVANSKRRADLRTQYGAEYPSSLWDAYFSSDSHLTGA